MSGRDDDDVAELLPAPSNKVLHVHGRPVDPASLTADQLRQLRAECLAALPKKKYQVLYADPPWAYRQLGKVEGRMAYPTMTLADLKALPVPELCASPCVLFLWCTNPLLDQALDLMKAWGFQYKTVFKVWLKRTPGGAPVMGCGWWSRPSTELVLCGARGAGYTKWKAKFDERQEFAGLRRAHSEKPPEVRQSIADFFPGATRLELFARHLSDGFDAWGLEVPGFFRERPDAASKKCDATAHADGG